MAAPVTATPCVRDKSNLSPELWRVLKARLPHFLPTGDALSDSCAANLGPFSPDKCVLFDSFPRVPLNAAGIVARCGTSPFFNPRPAPPPQGALSGEVFLEQVVDLLPSVVAEPSCTQAFLLQPLSSKATSKPGLRGTPEWITKLLRLGILLRVDHLAAFVPPGRYVSKKGPGRPTWQASVYGYQHWVLLTLGSPQRVAREQLVHSVWKPVDAFLRPTRPFPDLLAHASRISIGPHSWHLLTDLEKSEILPSPLDPPDTGVAEAGFPTELFAWVPKCSSAESTLRAQAPDAHLVVFRTNGTRFEKELFITIEGSERTLRQCCDLILRSHPEARCTWPDMLSPQWASKAGRVHTRFKIQRGKLQSLQAEGRNPQQFIAEVLGTTARVDLRRRLSLGPNGYDLVSYLTPAELQQCKDRWRALDEEHGVMLFSDDDIRIKLAAAQDVVRGGLSKVVCLHEVPCFVLPEAIHRALAQRGVRWDPAKFRVTRDSQVRRVLWLTLESETDKHRLLESQSLCCGPDTSVAVSDPLQSDSGPPAIPDPPDFLATATPINFAMAPSVINGIASGAPVGEVPPSLDPRPLFEAASLYGAINSSSPRPPVGAPAVLRSETPPASKPTGEPSHLPRKRSASASGPRRPYGRAPPRVSPASTPPSMIRKKLRTRGVDASPPPCQLDSPSSDSGSSVRTSEWDAAEASTSSSPPRLPVGGGRGE